VCGIAGEIRFDGRPADVAAVERITAAMEARGPDGVGLWARDAVAFGHRRLKVIDLSDAAAQPMVDSELGLSIVFNGCIYNYEELRLELEGAGYRFFSHGDTEVLLKAWHAWGEGMVERLNGMFAFAIHERATGRTVLARDRLGIKFMYLARDGKRLRFASTLPALLAGGGVDRSIDDVALHHYLSLHSIVPPPRTLLSGVEKLAPATIAIVEPDGAWRERRYWDARFERDPAKKDWSERDWEDAVLGALRKAVDRRLVADVPVGVLLSGGLDSSLIVGLLAEAGQRGLATFSIGFEAAGGEEGDEFRYSDVVAKRFETEHHQLRIGGARTLAALEGAIGAMSEPMVSHDAVGFWLLSQEVAKHVKVVQSGQGADEVFGGYHWYPPLMDVPEGSDGVDAYAAAFFDRPHDDLAALLRPAHRLDRDATRELVRERFLRAGASLPIDRALRIDQQVMLVDDPVKRVDNMTMAFGLEARVPFLDHELVELAAQCPPELKLAQGGKGVLKEAARRVIPAEVIDRPKGYFPVPALKHLAGETLEHVRDALASPAFRALDLFEPQPLEHLLAAPNAELTPLRGNKLWQLGLLALWLERHVLGADAGGGRA
jgi:asparagine synthase (glutamine-hydrolysing)